MLGHDRRRLFVPPANLSKWHSVGKQMPPFGTLPDMFDPYLWLDILNRVNNKLYPPCHGAHFSFPWSQFQQMALPVTHPAQQGHLLSVSLTSYQVQEGVQTVLPFKSQDFNAHRASGMLANLSFLSPGLPKQSSTQLRTFGAVDISDSGPQNPPMANSPRSDSLWHIISFCQPSHHHLRDFSNILPGQRPLSWHPLNPWHSCIGHKLLCSEYLFLFKPCSDVRPSSDLLQPVSNSLLRCLSLLSRQN